MSRSILAGALLAAVSLSLGCATAPRTAPVRAQLPAATTQECAWVTSFGADDVCGVAVPGGATLGCIRTGAKPHGVAVSRDGTRIYVSNEGANSLGVVDPTGRRVVAEVPVGQTPNQLAKRLAVGRIGGPSDR